LTDHQGDIAWAAQYKTWGQAKEVISEAAQKAGISNPIRFQGQYCDEEAGLHHNRRRYYDPTSGRFVSKDPIGLHGGDNLFASVPNPTEWVDPQGLKYFSKGRSNTVVSGKNKPKSSTQQLSEWRRKICPSKVGMERSKFLGDDLVKRSLESGEVRTARGNSA
jgi:RHS repeat-associated protein